MTRWAVGPTPVPRNTEICNAGSLARGTIAPLAIAGSFAAKLIVDTVGIGVLYGQIRMWPLAVGATTATFKTAACAVAGIPQVPVIGKDRVEPPARIGPPDGPGGLRVSTSRHGVIE